MESNSPSSTSSGLPDAEAARRALGEAAASRARVADSVSSPWWFHSGLGLAFALVCAAISLRWAEWAMGPFVLVVLGLGWALRRTSGVTFDRYTSTPDAARYFGVYLLACLVLVATGMTLEWGFDVRWAVACAGLVAGVLTVVMGFRIDTTVRRELRAGR
ncbi:hypothetical protein J7F02_14125 [Streptomyces sp. ISL-112]|uniref:hypothetical protein n=1 Tax=unclassified Streptomyces TaxID=2593676 RepID=UPI001BE8FB41|nr:MULTISPECIES: hypothetical protein [unclassified Streptomyces]MBT2426780.1 hypothetical protein [Streptomyces sp. ISL-112]MBT2461917.1 hypothetical protein [Streptomyces sp. ISL-63]